ncbi:MAG: hypothetical protein AB7K64_21290 [Variibacter sp.]
MGARTPRQIVFGSLCATASAGFCGGAFLLMGLKDALDGKTIGWIALASVPVFLICILIAGRKALAQVR